MPSSKTQATKKQPKGAAGAKGAAGGHAAATRTPAAQERMDQIVTAAVKVINESGLAGFSLSAVAAEVGISHVGVLHYVGSKKGLLLEVVKHAYDQNQAQTEFLDSFKPGGSREGEQPRIPEYARLIVESNANRREFVLLFHTLNTDSYLPGSVMHEYFAERTRNALDRDGVELAWAVPEGVDASTVFSCTWAAMYGLEGRWLARPDEVDLLAEWTQFENFLFPLPQWEGFR